MSVPGATLPTMGTAPGTDQQPTMPSAKHIVSKSLTVLQGRGYSLSASLAIIISTAEWAKTVLVMGGIDDAYWLADIADDASDRLRLLDPSHTDRTEHGNANRGSG